MPRTSASGSPDLRVSTVFSTSPQPPLNDPTHKIPLMAFCCNESVLNSITAAVFTPILRSSYSACAILQSNASVWQGEPPFQHRSRTPFSHAIIIRPIEWLGLPPGGKRDARLVSLCLYTLS